MNRYRDWLGQAERDLGRAQVDVEHEYWEWACFTSQQAAEKAVKALLMQRGVTVWGHAITPMMGQVEGLPAEADLVAKAQLLDAHYIPTRYPNGFPEGKPADYYNEQKALEAIDAARAIVGFCSSVLAGSGSDDSEASGVGGGDEGTVP